MTANELFKMYNEMKFGGGKECWKFGKVKLILFLSDFFYVRDWKPVRTAMGFVACWIEVACRSVLSRRYWDDGGSGGGWQMKVVLFSCLFNDPLLSGGRVYAYDDESCGARCDHSLGITVIFESFNPNWRAVREIKVIWSVNMRWDDEMLIFRFLNTKFMEIKFPEQHIYILLSPGLRAELMNVEVRDQRICGGRRLKFS